LVEKQSVTLTGREVQALLGAAVFQVHIPYVEVTKPTLSAAELELLEEADRKLMAARHKLEPPWSRDTPGWLEAMLNGEQEVSFTDAEARVLTKVMDACFAEIRTDGDLSAQVGPGVGLAALHSAYVKITSSL
jgi:hypothetical protein